MALGIAIMTSLLLFGHQMKERLYRDGAGIDAVVGAKGSPLQLILSSVQHVDIPTGNILLSEAERIKRHPHVKQAIPISLGDSYQRFRIVGTEPAYLAHFNAELAAGEVWHDAMQAVVGASAAQEAGLSIGDTLIGAHGLLPGGGGHSDHPYHVIGVLKPTGTVLDRLIVTSLDSVWNLHGHHEEEEEHEGGEHDHEHHDAHEEGHHETHAEEDKREITALLVKYRNRAAALSFPRIINRQTSMQAASPAFEMARLVDLIGIGTDTVFIFSVFLVSVALISVLIGLLNSIRERRYDLAIFRTLGASRKKVMAIVLMEGLIVTLIGSLFGLLIGHSFLELVGSFTSKGSEIGLKGFFFLTDVWIAWGIVLLLSAITCLIPAWEAYKTDIRRTLTHV